MLANVVWLLVSLPLVTWPAATAGLFTLVRRVVAEELDQAPHETRMADFWAGFKEHGVRSSVLSAIGLGGVVTVAVAILFYSRSPLEPLRFLVGPILLIGLVWIAAQQFVYPLLLQRPARRPREILREALLTALGYPLLAFPLLLTSLILAAAAAVLAGPVLFVFFSAMAMLQTVTLRHLLIARGEIVEAPPP